MCVYVCGVCRDKAGKRTSTPLAKVILKRLDDIETMLKGALDMREWHAHAEDARWIHGWMPAESFDVQATET